MSPSKRANTLKGDVISFPALLGFVSERAEEGHAVTLLNGVRYLEVERLLEALDAGKDLGEGLGPLVSARPGSIFLSSGLLKFNAMYPASGVMRCLSTLRFVVFCKSSWSTAVKS